jgi:TRAP-type C4-dicarboxylate transport system permease small subunit
MVIRIRFGKGPKIGRTRRKGRRAALTLAALLTPAAVMALALGCWRIAADLNWTSSFAISSGLFSHWQVWLGAAAILQLCARFLNRYARERDPAES